MNITRDGPGDNWHPSPKWLAVAALFCLTLVSIRMAGIDSEQGVTLLREILKTAIEVI